MPGENTVSADNQQATSSKISNEYLAGFIDGEGFGEIVDLIFSIPARGKKKYSREVLLAGASETIRQNSPVTGE